MQISQLEHMLLNQAKILKHDVMALELEIQTLRSRQSVMKIEAQKLENQAHASIIRNWKHTPAPSPSISSRPKQIDGRGKKLTNAEAEKLLAAIQAL